MSSRAYILAMVYIRSKCRMWDRRQLDCSRGCHNVVLTGVCARLVLLTKRSGANGRRCRHAASCRQVAQARLALLHFRSVYNSLPDNSTHCHLSFNVLNLASLRYHLADLPSSRSRFLSFAIVRAHTPTTSTVHLQVIFQHVCTTPGDFRISSVADEHTWCVDCYLVFMAFS